MASSIASPTDAVRSLPGSVWARARRPVTIAMASVVLVAAGLAATRTGLFRVRGLEVEGGSHRSRDQIARLSGVTERDNAIWLDETAVEARLLRDPWIGRAEVRVDLPWSVKITVTERSPVAVSRLGTEATLVAADGTILGPGRGAGLPVVDAPPAWVDPGGNRAIGEAARALAALDPMLRSKVRRVTIGDTRGLELLLTDGLRVRFGPPGAYAAKARVLGEVVTWIEGSDERIREIDVSAPSAPVVTPVA